MRNIYKLLFFFLCCCNVAAFAGRSSEEESIREDSTFSSILPHNQTQIREDLVTQQGETCRKEKNSAEAGETQEESIFDPSPSTAQTSSIKSSESTAPSYDPSILLAEEVEQHNQIEKDLEALTIILHSHNGNSFAYDQGYAQLGDRMIEFASQSINCNKKSNFMQVKELYEEDKKQNKLNSFRLTWLGFQLSLAFGEPLSTPHESRFGSIITAYIEDLLQKYDAQPIWLLPFSELENNFQFPFFNALKKCHLFSQPLAVYKGKSSFSVRDYLKATAQGVFLYCLNPSRGKGHMIHGGVYTTPAEKTMHDGTHFLNQWLTSGNSYKSPFTTFIEDKPLVEKYKKGANVWRNLARNTLNALNDPFLLSSEEQAKLEIMAFQILHEGPNTIPSLMQRLNNGPFSLIDVAKLAAKLWQEDLVSKLDLPDDKDEYYKEFCSDLERRLRRKGNFSIKIKEIEESSEYLYYANVLYTVSLEKSSAGTEELEYDVQTSIAAIDHYDKWKLFYRDLAHMLRSRKFWKPENIRLGTSYKISEIRQILCIDIYNWFLKSLEPGGKLYPVFNENYE